MQRQPNTRPMRVPRAFLAIAALVACLGATPAPTFKITPVCTEMVQKLAGPAGSLSTNSGLRYIIQTQGARNLGARNVAITQYVVCFNDGRQLEASTPTEPFAFTIGERQVIRGYEQSVTLAGTGGSIIARLPFWLAYGVKGSPPAVPPKSDFLFRIKIVGRAPAALSDRLLSALKQSGISGMQQAYAAAKRTDFSGVYAESADLDMLAYRLIKKQHRNDWAIAVLRLNLQRFPNDKQAAQLMASARKAHKTHKAT